MTAGTVVITGGILATVILLCIIIVLCYCRLQYYCCKEELETDSECYSEAEEPEHSFPSAPQLQPLKYHPEGWGFSPLPLHKPSHADQLCQSCTHQRLASPAQPSPWWVRNGGEWMDCHSYAPPEPPRSRSLCLSRSSTVREWYPHGHSVSTDV